MKHGKMSIATTNFKFFNFDFLIPTSPYLCSSLNPAMKNAYLKMHGAILLWGLTGIFGKLISLDELPLVWWRMAITAAILGVALLAAKQLQRMELKKAKPAIATGIVLALHWLCFFGSIKYSNVTIALSTLASTAMFTSIIQSVLQRRRPVARELVASAVTIVGVAVVFQFQELHFVGIILGLMSALLGSIFTITTEKLVKEQSPYNLLFVQLLGGVGVLSIIIPFVVANNPNLALLPVGWDWAYLLILAGVCTAYAMKLSYDALKVVSSFILNLSTNLEPVYSILLAFILFEEHKQLNTGFFVGSALIMASVVLGTVDFGALKLRTKKLALRK